MGIVKEEEAGEEFEDFPFTVEKVKKRDKGVFAGWIQNGLIFVFAGGI